MNVQISRDIFRNNEHLLYLIGVRNNIRLAINIKNRDD